jgi:Uma2 family endonuclease
MTQLEPLSTIRPLPLRVEDFLLLNDSGAFVDYGKTELIDGAVVYMNSQHRPHARLKLKVWRKLDEALARIAPDLEALTEVTISMPPHNAPEPDVVVTSEAEGEGPVPLETVRLIVEISESTLGQDLNVKAPLYARHGVPEYWVVDRGGRRIIQHWLPTANGYSQVQYVTIGETITSGAIAGLTISTADFH